MTKVITYGTYDLLHFGHIRLLKRAKALGDYLIVGVTADDFDKTRGKINVQQPLMERIEAVRETGIADEIIVEEYEGQKIDDICRNDVDIFTVGSDWEGKFDYLKEYCEVVYLERTDGISSSEVRDKRRTVRFGLLGDDSLLNKVRMEVGFVNGLQVVALCTNRIEVMGGELRSVDIVTDDFDEFIKHVDAVYVQSLPAKHYDQIKKILEMGKHVLCESPITLNQEQCRELFLLAENKGVILMDAIKTAYSTAFARLLLMVKGGEIGEVVSVDATCTSLKILEDRHQNVWEGIYGWAPTALLPIFRLLGTDYHDFKIVSRYADGEKNRGDFTKIDFIYNHAVASIKVGDGVKSEGELIISGTKGYVYVPAPWWKTDYFEIRYENQSDNKRYFYQLDGEGIRYELVAFVRAIERGRSMSNIDQEVSCGISEMMDHYVRGTNMSII